MNQNFRILMVAPTSFFKDYGGHIRILEETLALQSMGHRVAIVTYNMGNDVSGLDIRRTARLPWRADYEVGSSRHKVAFDAYLTFKALQVGFQFRPHIIHGHMHEGALIGGLVAKFLKVPLLFDFQGSLTAEMVDHGFLGQNGRIYPLARRLERIICGLPAAVLTSSHRAVDLLVNEYGVKREVVYPLPDCVDIGRFDPAMFTIEEKQTLRRELKIPEDRCLVVYLGLLADYQGTPHLIKAAAHLKQAGETIHFLIMGYPRVEHYRLLAQELGVSDRVTFTGKIRYKDAPRYLAMGDLAVSAKVSSTEGSGKVLNYMAMALPVVAFDTPVHREYLGQMGLFAPINDTAGFAGLIKDLAHDPEKRRRLGLGLRNRASTDFNWDVAADQIDAIYKVLTK